MKRIGGQSTTEMLFVLPLLIMLIGGGLFIVYSCWQGIKVQQAANLAARIQGQERVAGGRHVPEIEQTNGVGLGMSGVGDDDPTLPGAGERFRQRDPLGSSVYGKFRRRVRAMFAGSEDQVMVPPPKIGQNVDKVKVVRVIRLPKIPFLNRESGGPKVIKLEGTAYGGEDTYMYGLPRWGATQEHPEGEWRHLIRESANSRNR